VETPPQVVKAASHYLSGSCLTLFETQLKFSEVAPKGRRYSDDAKLLIYRFLSEMFALPSRSTLSVWLQSLRWISRGLWTSGGQRRWCRIESRRSWSCVAASTMHIAVNRHNFDRPRSLYAKFSWIHMVSSLAY